MAENKLPVIVHVREWEKSAARADARQDRENLVKWVLLVLAVGIVLVWGLVLLVPK